MKRSTRKLNKKNKNKAKQMGGSTREEWDAFTEKSLQAIKDRQELNSSIKAELLEFAKKYYELAWDTFQLQVGLQKKINEMNDNFSPDIKTILPEEQAQFDDDILGQINKMLSTPADE